MTQSVVKKLMFVVVMVALAPALCSNALFSATQQSSEVRFNRDVRPILAEACYHCHGPDPASRKAKMRFDRQEDFFAVHENGTVIVPGKPNDSLMWQRISTTDQDDIMPPPEAHYQLKAEQKDTLKRWIEQGAHWEKHWAFMAPDRPQEPQVAQPSWAHNPIDKFILARLETAKLNPAAEADRRTLARRLSLDLTGLPATVEQVEAFVADTHKDAYERYVDSLLAMPAYGEHRARYWLDAARYADTHGMHFDNYREMWPYRDWVINAFNTNMHFDQFTVEQLAGDLLKNPSQSQLIASGFQRCAMTTNEGGTIDEETLAGYARDRVETTSWVFLGLTANCAVCHDHKFDPISQHDFYSMSAYFRNTTQPAKDGNRRDTPPVLVVPKEPDKARWNEMKTLLSQAEENLEKRKKILRPEFDSWLEQATVAVWDAEAQKYSPPDLAISFSEPNANGGIEAITHLANVSQTQELTVTGDINWSSDETLGKHLEVTGKNVMSLISRAGEFERDKPFTVSLWIKLPIETKTGSIINRMNNDKGEGGWEIAVKNDELTVQLAHKWPDDAIKITTNGGKKAKTIKRDEWQYLTVTYDGSSKANGLHVYLNGQSAKTKTEKDNLKNSIKSVAPLYIARRAEGAALSEAHIQGLLLYSRVISFGEIKRNSVESEMRKLLAQEPSKRQPKQINTLFEIKIAEDQEFREKAQHLAELKEEEKSIRDRSPVAYIQEEKSDSKAMAYVLFRGQYDQKKEEVEPGVFAALHPLPTDAPKNRLGLAQWLVSGENGLTPRVIVNRLWQELFGVGLVKTSEDFGIMGEAPSHPELLNWLAFEFAQDWDVKRILKLMVCSATYRQAELATPEKIERDPANRLLSRGPRFRMDAEMIRDYALTVSGLLTRTIGGPSVKPYQPVGVWDAVGMPNNDTHIYNQDSGEALYRRSMYTFWKRQAPPAAMEVMNAPNREVSCLRRERTNTPLQALVTLNDPQFIEAARVLATQLVLTEKNDRERVALAGNRILLRPLSDEEKTIAVAIYARLLSYYQQHQDQAKELLSVGERKVDPAVNSVEVASLTMLCNQLFNLDEVLNK